MATRKRKRPHIKIFLSVLFVLAVSFFVVRSCTHPKQRPRTVKHAVTKPVPKKKLPQKMVRGPGLVRRSPPTAGVGGGGGKMAIILDDWGLNDALVEDAVAIGKPITLSILPHLEHSRLIAHRAHEAGLGVMLHMPMEPLGKSQPLEPETIRTSMADDEIIRYLNRALADVPFAQGVNNHMGSAATSNARVMRTVLGHLKKKNLFFVDSNTIATTVAPRVAEETGLRFASRDVFIDNELEPSAVRIQMNRAIRIARERGQAVVIGHDKEVTLRVIREMVPELERQGVKLVLAKDIVE